MPFASQAQARYLFATHPAVAKEFAAATPSIRALPQHVGKGAALLRKRKRRPQQLGVPPSANGATITGASTSTTRIGY